ncbi:MAG: hypothetical protein ACO39T_08815 [Flavobacteriaceae bacterium]
MSIYKEYLNSYEDIKDNYNAWLSNRDNIHWARYVEAHPDDLKPAWQEENKTTGISKWAWGYNHYQHSGKYEPRKTPKIVNTNGLPDIEGPDGRGGYTTIDIQQNAGSPQTSDAAEASFGLDHWESTGKNESRILPGPKLQYSNGRLQLVTSTIGTGAVQRYQKIINRFNNAPGGDYLQRINDSYNSLDAAGKNEFYSAVRTAVDSFYLAKKAPRPWEADTLLAQPPGGFEVDYYAETNPSVVTDYWRKVASGDLDFIGRYGSDSPNLYLMQHYTNEGRHQGLRGNEAKKAEGVTGFKETLTDAQRSGYRDQLLGITTDETTGKQSLVLATPEYDEEGNLKNPEEIDTQLEKEFAKILTATDAQKQRQFGALAQDVLAESINALKEAKAKEANLSFMKGLPGYSEILDINTTLANSILGDTGVGGLLSMTGTAKQAKSDLEKSIEQITGVSSNSTIYNWQKWFDETLLKRYEEYEYAVAEYSDEEIKAQQDQAKEEIKNYEEQVAAGEVDLEKPIYLKALDVLKEEDQSLDINNVDDFKKIMFEVNLQAQKDFVGSFINGYLKPRFDQSKSMDEFISYLDVKEDEQNIFQSQTTVNKLKQIADLRAKNFLDLIKQAEETEKQFDANFYFDPVGNNTKDIGAEKMAQYQIQKDVVAQDFADAADEDNPNAEFWATEAYRYGYEKDYKTNPETFARLHYQVRGRFQRLDENNKVFMFDPAEDILPVQELQQKIQDFGKELALRKELYGDASFMQFVTPEEYADSLLESIDPAQNNEEWRKILEQLGLDYTEDLGQVKEYLIESFRTEEAKTIRENIKYLNEAKEKLTQKTLGVSYIERKEDEKEVDAGETALYNIFKSAGYAGSEDEFYTDFMPDVDRSEQEVISKVMSDKGLTLEGLNADDPFSAFTGISSLMGEDGQLFESDKKDKSPVESSYFNIFGDDEEDLPQKSEAAQSFISDFTSMFKGFK